MFGEVSRARGLDMGVWEAAACLRVTLGRAGWSRARHPPLPVLLAASLASHLLCAGRGPGNRQPLWFVSSGSRSPGEPSGFSGWAGVTVPSPFHLLPTHNPKHPCQAPRHLRERARHTMHAHEHRFTEQWCMEHLLGVPPSCPGSSDSPGRLASALLGPTVQGRRGKS